jgi:hypothetical protein
MHSKLEDHAFFYSNLVTAMFHYHNAIFLFNIIGIFCHLVYSQKKDLEFDFQAFFPNILATIIYIYTHICRGHITPFLQHTHFLHDAPF